MSFEVNVLAACTRDRVYLSQVVDVLSPGMLEDGPARWMFVLARDTLTHTHDLLTPALVSEDLKNKFPPEAEEKDLYAAFARKVFKHAPKSPTASLAAIIKHARRVSLEHAIEEALGDIEQDDVDSAYQKIGACLINMPGSSSEKADGWAETFVERRREDEYEAQHPELHLVIPTGFDRIDEKLGGGHRKGELGLIMATTGVGKSICGVNLAVNAAYSGANVLVITTEMRKRAYLRRIDSCALGFEHSKLRAGVMSQVDAEFMVTRAKVACKKLMGRIRVARMSIRGSSTLGVQAELLKLAAEGWKPDVIIIDSPDHFRAIERQREARLNRAMVYEEVQQLAESGYAIWCMTQAGREHRGELVYAEAVAESYDVARLAHVIITMSQSKAMEAISELDMMLAKVRDAEGNYHDAIFADKKVMSLREKEEFEACPWIKAEAENDSDDEESNAAA